MYVEMSGSVLVYTLGTGWYPRFCSSLEPATKPTIRATRPQVPEMATRLVVDTPVVGSVLWEKILALGEALGAVGFRWTSLVAHSQQRGAEYGVEFGVAQYNVVWRVWRAAKATSW